MGGGGDWSKSWNPVKRDGKILFGLVLSRHPVDHPVAGSEFSSSHLSGWHLGGKKCRVMSKRVSGLRGVDLRWVVSFLLCWSRCGIKGLWGWTETRCRGKSDLNVTGRYKKKKKKKRK